VARRIDAVYVIYNEFKATQAWRWQSSVCSLLSSFSYSFALQFGLTLVFRPFFCCHHFPQSCFIGQRTALGSSVRWPCNHFISSC